MKHELYEDVIEAENSSQGFGIYRYNRVISVNKYLNNGKWIIGEGTDENIPFDCTSLIREEVKDWEKVEDIIKRFTIEGVKITVKRVKRKLEYRDKICEEDKIVNYVNFNGNLFAFTGSPRDIGAVLDYLKIETPRSLTRIWSIDRTAVILDPEASAKVFHEIFSLLKGDSPRVKKNEKLFSDLSVYDNPENPFSVGFYAFDDEGTKARKKEIIGDGYVLDYLGTLTTKLGTPGNGRGIIPKPDYFTLEIRRGDWGFQEMIEDTKNGILVLGAKSTEIVKNSVRLVPRESILIGNGSIILREIAIPFQEFLTIDGISRETKNVIIDNEHGGISPFIRIHARPILY